MQGQLQKRLAEERRDLLLKLETDLAQLYVLLLPETTLLLAIPDIALAHTFPSGLFSDVLIYIFGCVFSPEVLKHKVFSFSAGSLLTTSEEQALETKADNHEVDDLELLLGLKIWACTACSAPQFL